MNKTYRTQKENARTLAITWQQETSTQNLSYNEILEKSNFFAKLGKKYGLLKEFKTNGII